MIRLLSVLCLLAALAPTCAPLPAGPASDFADWPIDTTGYTIEPLDGAIVASFVRGNDVYLGFADGRLAQADDRDLGLPWIDLNSPLLTDPRLLFVSSTGVIFASPSGEPTYRSADAGITWTICLDTPTWRMDEDDQGNLYIGNYVKDADHIATLYKSADAGQTWQVVFTEPFNHHIHTVRWDNASQRLYITYGDGRTRGEAYSADRGETFTVLGGGRGHGYTDAAFTRDFAFWASDDGTGRLYRSDRDATAIEALTAGSQYVWWIVAGDEQVYVGTMTSSPAGGERAALLASHDQGDTWQKLLETDLSTGPYDQGFIGESRQLSASGWLYCRQGHSAYRVRRNP